MDVHIISNFSYFVKLENGLKIDEYDLLLYSNLGYNSYSRMVNKINNGNRDKLFIMSDNEFYTNQLHNDICLYIINNSTLIDSVSGYNIYRFEVLK